MVKPEKLEVLRKAMEQAGRELDEGCRVLRIAWTDVQRLQGNADWATLEYQEAHHDRD